MAPAPIALFAFNRPDHTRRTLESLASNPLAAQSELFVFCDGPRRDEDNAAISSVQDIARNFQGCKKVHLVAQRSNLGCAESIIRGVTQLCASHDRVIVLEDDLVLSPHFLDYMNGALERYADHHRVMQITGYIFPIDIHSDMDAFFLPFTSSLGWATWARAWKCLDKNIDGYHALESNASLRKKFDLDGAYPYFDMLTAQREGRLDSWAIRWYLGTFLAGGATLFPKRSLVKNIGWDGSGTHCQATNHCDKMDPSFRVSKFPDGRRLVLDMDVVARIRFFLQNGEQEMPKSLISRLRKWFP